MVERMSFDTSMATVKFPPCLRCKKDSINGTYCPYCTSSAHWRGEAKFNRWQTDDIVSTWWSTTDAVGFGKLPEEAYKISLDEAQVYFHHLEIEYEEYISKIY